MRFIDTNILVYASGLHGEEDPRTQVARSIILADEAGMFSIQVLQEFVDRVTRGTVRSLSEDRVLAVLTLWRERFTIQPLTLELFDHAMAIKARYRFRYWDCAIIAAALAGGCTVLLTEDMQDGQIVDGLKIENPFRGIPVKG